ncbi:hypothetical protein Q3C01_23875 [Bradyrhizobium sp. UFLA05-109]
MLKADSNDTTIASRNTPSSEVAVAASQPSLLNDSAGANEPAVNRSKRMTRRNAMTSAAATAASLALTLKPTGAAPQRRGLLPKHDAEFTALLDEYRAARRDLFAAEDRLESARELLPEEFWYVRNFSPSIVLIPGRGRMPDQIASSHEDIDAFMATVDVSPESRVDPESNMNVWARERRAELETVKQRYEDACRLAGVTAIKDTFQRAVQREKDALEAIAVTQPRTIEGCLAQAAFLSTYLEQEETDEQEFAQRLCRSLAQAMARLADTPMPRVPDYRFV